MRRLPVDHLVYAAPDLDLAIEEIATRLGITATPGGQHPGRGTRNALVALGPDVYLEIVAPDPHQPAPPTERWLGVDAVTHPRLTAWAAKGNDLAALRTRALYNDVSIGAVQAGARQRADGTQLSWQLTEPQTLVVPAVIPFFIDWGHSAHPAQSAAQGASLIDLRIEHPDVAAVHRMLAVLDLDVMVEHATTAALVAVLEGRHGRIELR